VICEMLTGSRPELSRTSADELRRQLDEWLKRQPGQKLNARARRVIRRCLEFRPGTVSATSAISSRHRRHQASQASAPSLPAAAAVAAALVVALARSALDAGPRVKDAVLLTPESGLSAAPGISRDGKWIVYASDRAQPGNLDIWTNPLWGDLRNA